MMYRLALLAWLLACSTAQAITCGDVTEFNDTTPADPETIAYTTPSGSNQVLFVGVGTRNGTSAATVSSVTHAGNGMTATATGVYLDPAYAVLYYIVNPTSGTNNVVVDKSAAGLANTVVIWVCSGVDTTNPIANAPTGTTGNSTTPSITATTAAGQMVVDFFFQDTQAADPTQGANQTILAAGNDGTESGWGASYQNGADGGVMSWTTDTSQQWAQQAVSLNPVAGGGAVRRRTF